MITTTPARYKKFPSLTNPALSKSPENQQTIRKLKEMYDNHSKDWDKETRYNIIDHVLNGDTEVTERIARAPNKHKLLQRNMTFAIWIVLRATYGFERLSRLQYRFIEKFPGIDPASLVSPVLAKKTKVGPLEDGEDYAPPYLDPPPPTRAPSIFGPVDVSQFTYRHEQDASQKRKGPDFANFQPWKIPKTTVKREPDAANFLNTLRPPAFPQVYLLPTEESRNTASPVHNAPLPSIESPFRSLDPEQEVSMSQQDKENCDPPLRPSLQRPAQASRSVQSIESGNIGTSPSPSSSQIPPSR
ncbi:hypothetical protein FPOAC1_002611 [Fusarium poae]|uniref:hypothetical protein n=1 Tax=Fusarium poae TaxID=36050 RepID=UPI001CE808B2|nr:hypothetical protein FPOAC1_002611 [Fusarium poae]KAG8676604.1 hypothetical protein FPOAC1_002611 [Fusarium poae]